MTDLATASVAEHEARERKLKKITGFTSNDIGRVFSTTLYQYNHMIRNKDTLLDENGLDERFIRISDKEAKILQSSNKNGLDEKLAEKSNKICIDKISQLTNFMSRFLNGDFGDLESEDEEDIKEMQKKLGLRPAVIEGLKKVKIVAETVDNSEELKAKNKLIKDGQAEIDRLNAELKEAKKVKTPATPKVTAPKTPKVEDKKNDSKAPEDKGGNADEKKDNPFG